MVLVPKLACSLSQRLAVAAGEHEFERVDPALNFHRTAGLLALETAAYNFLAAFTTLRFGDIVVDKPYRLMVSLLAANGLILFGLTAALLIEFINSLHITRAGSDPPPNAQQSHRHQDERSTVPPCDGRVDRPWERSRSRARR